MNDAVMLEGDMSAVDAAPDPAPAFDYEVWLEAVLSIARHYRLECSAQSVRLAAQWTEGASVEDVVRQMARQAGLNCAIADFNASTLMQRQLPMILQFSDGQVGVLETLGDGEHVGIAYSGDGGLQSRLSCLELLDSARKSVILRPMSAVRDTRVDDYIKPYEKDWFKGIVLRDMRPYGYVMLASLVTSVLGLAGVLFSMQVYDRVIPAESMPTLYVLFGGVMLALVFDFIMRITRVRITDMLGKRADMRVSDLVFGHAIRLRNSARPKSTGSFISQLKELEQLRELITSSTATALADLPFFLLFLVIYWLIAGPLVAVPMVAVLFLVVPGVLSQKKLAVLANQSMRESSLRSAMLVETIQGLDDIKALQAEQRFEHQWNHYNATCGDASLRLRMLTNKLMAWTNNVQGSVFAVVVVFGAPMVMASDMTTGSLVAASILASRMMAPMSQVTQVLTRWQQAKVALQSLNRLMELPVDHAEGSKRVHLPVVSGHYVLKQAAFQYSDDAPAPALLVADLQIQPGERIAILGRNGAGKSTLLQALAGMLDLKSGSISLDGVALGHIDPADVRRDVGLMTQNSRLFHGTLRDNLIMGAPHASDQEILQALALTGAADFIGKFADGMDHMILEGGLGLSGGQRQSLLLSRLIIRQPHIVLLDEPTASLDEATERQLIHNLDKWAAHRTLVIATHRMSVLSLVNRIIVVDNGQILVDDTKDNAIARLSKTKGKNQ
ncbi:type I secretion system permease/ATPase [Pseudomonas fluorescens]|uniref:type I secretion system permease/ATPase n=2 Tax=Gammaproteobacteria TaxID=1236 RepID=UPI000EA9491A|nr:MULTISPECIES: type I secretion system permease/ATPase [Pseudomonas]AYG06162.1 type I secretion system permease/ATPase [Pseudomonas fluorescens]MDZ4301834.1 type I secretion system permease/ATPase [Pseudomonas sp.]MBJ2264572.1 type I secretion system permease/ATPase [Pseudomonas sp. MF6787]MCM8562124.1 type I secretion system permease/ATPase [Pseudomonas shahriarae]QXH90086.1 type I secretion system permease/ATPase [Pseudomonas shahriarae]